MRKTCGASIKIGGTRFICNIKHQRWSSHGTAFQRGRRHIAIYWQDSAWKDEQK